MTEEEYSKITLDALNEQREKKGLGHLRLDRKQSKNAMNISRQLKDQQGNSYVLTGNPVVRQVLSYVTEDPGVWPTNLNPDLLKPGLKRIGIGICSLENEETRKRTFWVTLIF
jgi:hypothetical protein